MGSEQRPVMDPEIRMKSLRISRYGGDIFLLPQEARRSVKWGEKKGERNGKISIYINRK